jgi:glycosyltransferase involved in cell wall biosynthesis
MLSIITPTHKERPLLDLTIKSVLSQSYSDFEWVVLDNSMEGYFEDKLNEFLINNPKYETRRQKVKIIHKVYDEVNIGKLKNECVRIASCRDDEFILLLDHDDFLVNDCLLNIYKYSNIYPHAQFISGDSVQIFYNIQSNLFNFYRYHDLSKFDDLDKYNGVSGDLKIRVDDFCIDFGVIENYTFRPYLVDFSGKLNNIPTINNYIYSHPRCIKKYILLNPIYQFYEGHSISEDTVQCLIIGNFLQGVYIPSLMYTSILYNDTDNTSFAPVSDKCKFEYDQMIEAVREFSKNIEKLFPNLPEMNSILNKDELKSN